MAVMLYRKGNTHTVRGIECEAGRFEVRSMAGALRSGWVADPKELVETPKEAPTKEEADTNNSGKLSSDEVRAAAKEADIEGWDKKRIKTLKEILGYDD